MKMADIGKRFGATVALSDVSFQVSPGQVHALVGENGAGKSTLMKIFSGAIQPDSGNMQLAQKPYRPRNPLDARRLGIAMIYQELSLAPHLSVEENILLGMEPTRFSFIQRKTMRQRAVEALKHFDHPEIKPDIPVGKLSVAAQQLVEIARALAVGSKVLILDEPTSSLTQRDVEQLFDLIQRLKKQGLAIIYISHFLEEVRRVADSVTVLRDGQTVGHNKISEISIDQIVSLMVGRQINDLYPRSTREPGQIVLDIANLSGRQKPLNANLQLRRGEILGIAGLMGAGRTELLRAIFGLDPVRQGKIKLGLYTGPASPMRRWKQNMGMLSEDRQNEGLALSMTIADNITLSNLNNFGPCKIVLPRRQAQTTQKWIQKLNIRAASPHQPLCDLSGGNQQKVALARLLQHDVDVLLLDEPTRGIDVAAKAAIYNIIDQLATGAKEQNRPPKAILMVSSYLPELTGICDRIAVMCRGKLHPARPTAQTNQHKLMLEATGQESSS